MAIETQYVLYAFVVIFFWCNNSLLDNMHSMVSNMQHDTNLFMAVGFVALSNIVLLKWYKNDVPDSVMFTYIACSVGYLSIMASHHLHGTRPEVMLAVIFVCLINLFNLVKAVMDEPSSPTPSQVSSAVDASAVL